MDISHELWSLVDQARARTSAAPVAAAVRKAPHARKLASTEVPATKSLLTTSHALNDAAAEAIYRASAHIAAVVAAVDAATPSSTAALQNCLLLSDAELLSVGSSLKAFAESLVKAGGTRLDPTDTAASDGEGRSSSGSGVVAHLQCTVSILEQRIAAKRLRVALAKEELALYKSELTLYGHCGVLSCSDEVAAKLVRCRDAMTHESPMTEALSRRDADWAHHEVDGVPQGPHKVPPTGRSGFGTTFRVVDGMMQKAARTVKAAGSHADSALQVALTGGHAAARQLLQAGTTSVDELLAFTGTGAAGSVSSAVDGGSGGGSTDANGLARRTQFSHGGGGRGLGVLVPLPQLEPFCVRDVTEEAHLREQNAALLLEQQAATAQDAKAVEASIRELSQLTSLMNEQVVQQTEQFSLLVKNAEAAQTNVKKAVGEVAKPLQAFWNPTRQLVALLWACMALLLTVNWAAR